MDPYPDAGREGPKGSPTSDTEGGHVGAAQTEARTGDIAKSSEDANVGPWPQDLANGVARA